MAATVLMAHPSPDLYGSDRVFLESVVALADAGFQVVVVLPADGPLVPILREHGARVVFALTPVLRKAALRPRGFLQLAGTGARAVRPAVRLIREVRPDLVYVNTVTLPAWAVLARALRKRVLIHVHEAEDGVPAPIRLGLAAPLLTAATVVVNSRATERSLRRTLPAIGRRLRLIYNGVPGPPTPSVRRPDLPARARLVQVGRVSPRKGTDTAVDAAAILQQRDRDIELHIVGSVFPGYEWFEEELRARVSMQGLTDRVRFDGFRPDVWSAYDDADIALVPSRSEPFGNTAVEAQLAGTPVIVSDVQGLPETVDNGQYGAIVPADDPAALADAIEAALDDWPAAVKRADAAREVAIERFSPERYRAQIVSAVTGAL